MNWRRPAALLAGKTAAKDIGMKVLDVSKTFAIDAGKKLVERLLKVIPTNITSG